MLIGSLQTRVAEWVETAFGARVAADKVEGNHRFLEEALELVQSLGCPQSDAHELVRYVYGRPQGEVNQEVGDVMLTLMALCNASDIDVTRASEKELKRV